MYNLNLQYYHKRNSNPESNPNPNPNSNFTAMNELEVETLDGALAEGNRWHGCILCPSAEGQGEPYNLLTHGTLVKFYKSNTSGMHSRQATDGTIIPTSYPAIVGEWPRVLTQLEQWAFEGNSPITCHSDRGSTRQNLLNKLLQCPRALMYQPKSPQEFDKKGLLQGISLRGIRQNRLQKTTLQKRVRAQCEPN